MQPKSTQNSKSRRLSITTFFKEAWSTVSISQFSVPSDSSNDNTTPSRFVNLSDDKQYLQWLKNSLQKRRGFLAKAEAFTYAGASAGNLTLRKRNIQG